MTFTFTDEPTADGALAPVAGQAVLNFLRLGPADRDAASARVLNHYREFVAAVGPNDVEVDIARPADVWKHVRPTHIHVGLARSGTDDPEVYVAIACECAWEIEHGLQLVYRRGSTLVRVSDQDGHMTGRSA